MLCHTATSFKTLCQHLILTRLSLALEPIPCDSLSAKRVAAEKGAARGTLWLGQMSYATLQQMAQHRSIASLGHWLASKLDYIPRCQRWRRRSFKSTRMLKHHKTPGRYGLQR